MNYFWSPFQKWWRMIAKEEKANKEEMEGIGKLLKESSVHEKMD